MQLVFIWTALWLAIWQRRSELYVLGRLWKHHDTSCFYGRIQF